MEGLERENEKIKEGRGTGRRKDEGARDRENKKGRMQHRKKAGW